MDEQSTTLEKIKGTLKVQIIILGSFVALFWAIEIVDALIFRGGLDVYGVHPRSMIGLRGILFAPFLHVGFGHAAANTIPFLVLGWFVLMQGVEEFVTVTAVSILVGGLGAWLFGASNSVHVGSSVLVFGYFGYLVLRGIIERSLIAIMWSILALALYGGMIWGVFPTRVGISWQMHLFGFIGGGMAAYWLNGRRLQNQIYIGDEF